MHVRPFEWGPIALEAIARQFVVANGLKLSAVRKLMAKAFVALSHKAKQAKQAKAGTASKRSG
jgi:hypothetical protein